MGPVVIASHGRPLCAASPPQVTITCASLSGGLPAELERKKADHGHQCSDGTDGQLICETVSSSEPEVLRQGR